MNRPDGIENIALKILVLEDSRFDLELHRQGAFGYVSKVQLEQLPTVINQALDETGERSECR